MKSMKEMIVEFFTSLTKEKLIERILTFLNSSEMQQNYQFSIDELDIENADMDELMGMLFVLFWINYEIKKECL